MMSEHDLQDSEMDRMKEDGEESWESFNPEIVFKTMGVEKIRNS